MRLGITYRLFLSILGAACVSVLAMFLVMQWSINRGFLDYLGKLERDRLPHLAEGLGQEFGRRGNWDFLRNDPLPVIDRLIGGPPVGAFERNDRRPPLPPPHGPGPVPVPFADGPGGPNGRPPLPPPNGLHRPLLFPIVVLDADRKPLFGNSAALDKTDRLTRVLYNGKTVGFVGLIKPPQRLLTPRQLEFLARQKTALAYGACGMFLVVILFSLPLSRHLLRPVRAMASATRDVTAGEYGVRIPVSSSDELGQLAHSFNLMALALERNEKARRQWVADISHELRTPVAVLQGEIEALLDGVRPINPEAVRSLHGEALRLHRLVDDLYQLALSDLGALTYRKENVDLGDILTDCIETFHPRFEEKKIALGTPDVPEGLVVFGDAQRLHQLFANLFDNSLKYTDPGGALRLSVDHSGGSITVVLEDTPPAVPQNQLERLFERLYRVDVSRSRASGGSGLGLSICKNIAEAHEGSISAGLSSLGGLSITVTLPRTHEEYP
jgi:two-component system sensor histidine kinase BaeS